MGIPIFVIAIVLFAAAYQNQLGYLAQNAEEDLKGAITWIAAMAAIGVIGLIPKARPISNALFFLVILVLLISNKGIFANIASGQAFKPQSPPKAPPVAGAKAVPASAGPGVKASGSIDAGAGVAGSASGSAGVGAGATGGAAIVGGAGGILSNVIPFPNLKFGSFDLGNVLGNTGGNVASNIPVQDSSGVTIENIDFGL